MSKGIEDIELRFWDGLRKGHADSFEWIYNRYFKLLYNYGRKIAADEKSLEDGIHDLFVDLWRFRRMWTRQWWRGRRWHRGRYRTR